jgi:hypothetical protein
LKVLKILMTCFAVISVLSLPVMIIYSQGNQYGSSFFMEALSLGNIGEARSVCIHQFLGISREEKLSCNVGVMTGVKKYGI